ncbi:hypothetical protein LCGC14_2049870 [marine sediment metagenome]|uniref:Uncharacterized protein n=1 Tax=marine sediment metagenome TaxID=412755 RepID=A0A0F9HLB3_9ZZZZ
MGKPVMVTVARGLVLAVQDLRKSKQWSVLPQEMRTRIERGLKGKE